MKFKSRLVWVLFFSLVFFINSGFTVVGHRGDPIKYPEETIPPLILVLITLNSISSSQRMEFRSLHMMMTSSELLIHMQLYHKIILQHLNNCNMTMANTLCHSVSFLSIIKINQTLNLS